MCTAPTPPSLLMPLELATCVVSRGLWRRTTLTNYRNKAPNWETLLDFNRLAEEEHEDWVFQEVVCLPPQFVKCMIALSRGGKDAAVHREFDLDAKRFTGTVPNAQCSVATDPFLRGACAD